MEAKKISFSFSKVNKKSSLLTTRENTKTVNKVELIKCLEGQEIKLVEEKPDEQPLIIPLNESQKTSGALASLMKRRAVLLGEEEPENTDVASEPSTFANNEGPEDIEKRAARELLADIKKTGSSDRANNLVLPVVKPEDLPLEGAKESTIDDYESVPIQDFGKAILRGMGWTEPLPKKNKKGDQTPDDMPVVRPKGMGLGADKALSRKPLLVAPDANEVLEIKRNAYVRILGGKYKDLYGQIEGFDDHAGRVIVKMAIGGTKEAFNEFLCQPVSRKEYAQYGKCINSNKYEEYKKKENEYGQIIVDKDEKYSITKKEIHVKKERHFSDKHKYEKNNSEYEINRNKGLLQNEEKEMKIKGDRYKERRSDGNREENDGKNFSKDVGRGSRKETNKDDCRDHRRYYEDTDKEIQIRDHANDRQRKPDGHELKSDYPRSETLKRTDDDDYKSTREYERSYNKNRDTEREHDRKTYAERSDEPQHKRINSVDLSDSEADSYSSKHRKYEKRNQKKKSKKSKKSKSKHKSYSSEEEMSSASKHSSSDSQNERHKKHKKSKKSKKNKKQRERSRSRERR